MRTANCDVVRRGLRSRRSTIDFEDKDDFESTRLAVVERYDPERRRWIDDVASMSTPRSRDEIVSCANRICGMSLARDEMSCELFNSTTGTWTSVASPGGGGERRLENGYILSSLAGKIFAIGREMSSGKFGHMTYDPSENRWLDFRPDNDVKSIVDSSSIFYGSIGDRLYIFSFGSLHVFFDDRSERSSADDDWSHSFRLKRTYGLAADSDCKRLLLLGRSLRDGELVLLVVSQDDDGGVKEWKESDWPSSKFRDAVN